MIRDKADVTAADPVIAAGVNGGLGFDHALTPQFKISLRDHG